ncbi:MAG: hypothetical protein ACJ79S_13830 [Gemmatimonadaceae bacterium]
MRRPHPARAVSLAAASLVLVACAAAATSRPSPVDTARRTLVYGHIDAPKRLQSVQIKKVGSFREPRAWVFDNGDFFFENLPPGDYLLVGFIAGGEQYSLRSWNLESNRRFVVHTTPGGMHFAGSWRVTGVSGGLLTPSKFSVERNDAPSGQALLQRLRPSLEGSGWERKVGSAAGTAGPEAQTVPRAKSGA